MCFWKNGRGDSAVRVIEPSEVDIWTFDARVTGLEILHVLVQDDGLVGCKRNFFLILGIL